MDELIADLLIKYENGNKKALGDIFGIKKDYIAKLFDDGVNIKTIKFSLEKELKIIIKDDTFYKWIKRNIKNKKHNADALNSNEKNKSKRGEDDIKKLTENKNIEDIMNSNIGTDLFNKYK